MNNGLQHGEKATVLKDGNEFDVYDHVSVTQNHYVNSVNGYETFEPQIAIGDTGDGPQPEAVTKRVGKLLYDEFNINPKEHGIEIVDMTSDDVERI